MHKNLPELVVGPAHPLKIPYNGLRIEIYFLPKRCRSTLFIVTSSQTTSFCAVRAEDSAGSSDDYTSYLIKRPFLEKVYVRSPRNLNLVCMKDSTIYTP